MHKALKSTAQVYKISVGGKNRDVIIKSMQYHPISEDVLHIDLYGVKMDTKVNVKVPIVFIGQCEGVKAGGVLNQNISELEIACLPSAIPQNIELDISNLNIGDTLRLSDITLDDTIEGTTHTSSFVGTNLQRSISACYFELLDTLRFEIIFPSIF